MSRFAVSALTVVLLAGSWSTAAAQGPVRNSLREVRQVRADYPGPIAYSPSDPDFRSKRYRMQTGHYGLFYNCDGEECKRNSPYIYWGAQQNADCFNGWRTALRRDRHDVIQRILDGSCAEDDCEQCEAGYQGYSMPQYGQRQPAMFQTGNQLFQPRNQTTQPRVQLFQPRNLLMQQRSRMAQPGNQMIQPGSQMGQTGNQPARVSQRNNNRLPAINAGALERR